MQKPNKASTSCNTGYFSDMTKIIYPVSSNNVSNNNVCRYDVFLSFRGETRHGFTDHLYTALLNAGLVPFRDNDDIDRGEDLKPEIKRGIRESRASIVVLSDKYATSRWCLDELCLILEQATTRRHFVLPIFYHVDPSHVRNQEESFEINVECNTQWTEDNVEKWKAALKKVGNMTGVVSSGSETKFLEKIVGIIEKRLDLKKVYCKANLVGMDNWQKEIEDWLENSSAQILVVWGMGGIGKTTLARHIVYSNWENFGSISILEDIGSKSTEQLHELQQKLLRDILQGKKRKIPSVWQGTCKIENALITEKAIIVLDNIVELGHLFLLLGAGTETQCKIIITTRERNPQWFDQSTSWRCQYLEMKSLDMNDSLELLCLHAFGSKALTEGYDHLIEKALRYCEGNPLALEVLGSSLSQNNKQLWESRLNSFETELHARIHSVLIGTYESLPLDCDRELFLHIACFFVGKDMDYVVKILEPDYSALSGIETLFKRCLLSVSPDKKLMMHRMFQEMARTIVYKESPKNPAKRSRVWRDKESYDILLEGKGSKKVEGLALDIKLLNQGKESEYESLDLTTESFKKMDKLKLLQLNCVNLTGPYMNFSKQLRWLCWAGYSLRAIPSDLCMKNLVAIDMSYSCLEEFEPPMHLHSLKILNLRSSKYLREIHNIYRLRNLEILILWNCISLTRVTTLGGLTCLAILNITGCEKLCTREETSLLVSQEGSSYHAIKSTQQPSFLLPQSLERLFSSSCDLSDTDYFLLTFNDQPLLIYLNLVNGLFTFLPSYNHLKRLRVLDVSGCNDLKELRCLPSTLAELYIYYCNSLNIVTFESHRFTLQEFGYEGCVNLCEVEGLFKLMPVNKLEQSDMKYMSWLKEYQDLQVCLVGDVKLTKGRSSCVQMLYEFNIMSTSLPKIKNSNMMTDTDYMYTSQSTLLSFEVPACPEHRRLEGLIITFQYTTHGEDWVWFAKVSTSNGFNLIYNPRVFGKPDEVGMWSSYWPIGKALNVEERVIVSIIVIKGLLDIHWCGANLVYTDEGANESLQVNQECVAILGDDFSEFQLSTGAYYLCRRDFFELMEAGKLTPDWFRILVDNKINYIEVGGWRMTGKPGHPYQSYTELKTIRCIMYGPEMEGIYKIAELSKSSLVDNTMESTSELNKAIPMDISVASTTSSLSDTIECSGSESESEWSSSSTLLQQSNHHGSGVVGGDVGKNPSFSPPRLPSRPGDGGGGGGGGEGSIRPGSMVDRARLAKLPLPESGLNCPRCDSTNTKFCFYNNYSLTQPRHFCKTCRRYWTRGGALRNVPVGGGCKRKKISSKSRSSKSPNRSGPKSPSVSPPSSNSENMTSSQLSHPPSLHLPFMSSFNQYGGVGGNLSSSAISGFQPQIGDGSSRANNFNNILSIGGGENWRLPFLPGGEVPKNTNNLFNYQHGSVTGTQPSPMVGGDMTLKNNPGTDETQIDPQ